ncbi:Lrp/AsnC family transcriptional regulator [Pseudonocardia sp. HH130630-07]|uniref:Lrp/AsnC family transcriptional regulator n=1 Tax=Pseudonocardia sp. HH130630-07 TaxID=1690815 RepID=UPI000814F963|nr:Lrp/AsnC family transcriptional regulator [Pseudonocardia sp. HH130630-07]ANY07585.1 AsnC family transcriptional regulator [Pseudonocardia sp. HH130630-07]
MSEEDSVSVGRRAAGPNVVRLDETDRRLLRLLEQDARTPNNALAEAVGIAPSTCLGRIRALRERGVIRGYHADVDPAATGHPLQAMIFVTLQADARDRLDEFVTRSSRLPEVRDVYFLAGADDYMLRVASADTGALRRLVGVLNSWGEVAGTRTSLIFEHHRAPDTY